MMVLGDGSYWLDTGFACGGVTIAAGRVVKRETASIFISLFRNGLFTRPDWKWVLLGA